MISKSGPKAQTGAIEDKIRRRSYSTSPREKYNPNNRFVICDGGILNEPIGHFLLRVHGDGKTRLGELDVETQPLVRSRQVMIHRRNQNPRSVDSLNIDTVLTVECIARLQLSVDRQFAMALAAQDGKFSTPEDAAKLPLGPDLKPQKALKARRPYKSKVMRHGPDGPVSDTQEGEPQKQSSDVGPTIYALLRTDAMLAMPMREGTLTGQTLQKARPRFYNELKIECEIIGNYVKKHSALPDPRVAAKLRVLARLEPDTVITEARLTAIEEMITKIAKAERVMEQQQGRESLRTAAVRPDGRATDGATLQ